MDALIDLWTDALVSGKRIEVEKFIILQVIEVNRGSKTGTLSNTQNIPTKIHRVTLRTSKELRSRIKKHYGNKI